MLFRSICASILPASADELAKAGRAVVAKWQDAIVTAQLVIKTTVTYEGEQSPPQEDKVEANALVIDGAGLVVTPLSEISPDESMADFLGEEADKYKISTEITDVKILLGNGQEIPATVVLRDKELDLAFLRATTKPEKPLTAIDLAKGSKPELLDNVLALSRQGTAANRAVAASLDRIETIRSDAKIDGADPTIAALTGKIEVRFADTTLLTQAINGTSAALEFSYVLPSGESLTLTAHAVYLPRPRIEIKGPKGVQASFDWQAALAVTPVRMCTVVLVNNIASY